MYSLIFYGSPQFSADTLESLLTPESKKQLRVVAVVTQPDKPIGRKRLLTPSPVAIVATKHHLPTFKPSTLDSGNLEHLKLFHADFALVAAYGKIIPDSYLQSTRLGFLNLHFSLLPKYRGALCVSEPIKNGDSVTGVTLMEMDSELDHGNIIAQKETAIDIDDNVATLLTKLTESGINLLQEKLAPYLNHPTSSPQNHALATYTPKTSTRNHQSAFIPYSDILTPQTHNLIRSLNPDPGAWTIINGQEVKILKTHLSTNDYQLIPTLVQLPGKSPISWKQFSTRLQPRA